MQKINFDFSQANNCCGMHEVGGFEWRNERQWGQPANFKEPVYTKETVLHAFTENLEEYIKDYINEDNYGEDKCPKGGLFLQASFVTELGKDQRHSEAKAFVFLMEHLLENGWKKHLSFVNYNTENTVAVIYKQIKAKDYWEEKESDPFEMDRDF